VDNSLSTELSASKYYKPTYAQESVDKVGQNPWITQRWSLAVGGRDPPLAGLAGATVAALNTYKKKFLKNLKTNLPNKSNCAKMSTPQTTE